MAKSDLGTKRVCPTTGKKFYDLNKSPVISPYTGEVVPIAPVAGTRGRADQRAAAAADTEAPEVMEEMDGNEYPPNDFWYYSDLDWTDGCDRAMIIHQEVN